MSVEDILQALTDSPHSPVEVVNVVEERVRQFVSFYKLTPGANVVPKRIVSKMFRLWDKKNPVGSTAARVYLEQTLPFTDDGFLLSQTKEEVAGHVTPSEKRKYAAASTIHVTTGSSFQEKAQSINDFVDRVKLEDGSYVIKLAQLYKVYKLWCTSRRVYKKPTEARFFRDMMEKSYRSKRVNGQLYVYVSNSIVRYVEELKDENRQKYKEKVKADKLKAKQEEEHEDSSKDWKEEEQGESSQGDETQQAEVSSTQPTLQPEDQN